MDDSLILDSFTRGEVTVEVWKCSDYDDDGYCQNVEYMLNLGSRTSRSAMFNIMELPDLVSALEESLTCVKDHTAGMLRVQTDRLAAALRDAASPVH